MDIKIPETKNGKNLLTERELLVSIDEILIDHQKTRAKKLKKLKKLLIQKVEQSGRYCSDPAILNKLATYRESMNNLTDDYEILDNEVGLIIDALI